MIDQTEQVIREGVSSSDELVGANGHDQPSRYVVHLPVFEGPLDLLLHLIEKRQMEITTISLVAVTDQYLAYLQRWQEPGSISLSNMAAFISIAARLLYIKSQSLLPSISKEELTSEMENVAVMAEELSAHLLEYKLAKEIAGYLRLREESGLQTYGRSGFLAGIEAQLTWMPPTLLGLHVDSLATTFQRLLEQQAKEEANNDILIPAARVRVSERIAEIVALLRARSSIHLSDVLENEHSRTVIIVTFLAVLELMKRERIRVKQTALFDPILLERGERWSENEQLSEEELEYGT
ncbi:MAG TPA: segregation/condensation protein A [Ktedonobacteraceae bacterium]|nr:segregation/condensation protein A [Ktedonobacteraceae bacterium]